MWGTAMKVILFKTLPLFLVSSSVCSQQYKTIFNIGVAVGVDQTSSGICTEEESTFIETRLKEYTVNVARLFFRDETLQLDDPLVPIDETHFEKKAFQDFNVFEAKKADRGTREDIPLNTIPPGATLTPSASPVPAIASTIVSSAMKSSAIVSTQGPTPILITCDKKKEKEICVQVNFNTLPNGTPLENGQYVSNEWWGAYGLKISVAGVSAGTYSPRIFDSGKPGEQHQFGSPNIMCLGAGPGSGAGGEPGEPGENCSPLGNTLIIQKGSQLTPQPTSQGGYFTFTFEKPVHLKSLDLMGVTNEGANFVETVDDKGKVSKRNECKNLGVNSVQEVKIDKGDNVVKAILHVTEAVAVSQLDFCVPLCEVPSSGIGARRRVRNLSVTAPQESLSQDESKLYHHQANRELSWNFRQSSFKWGAQGSFTCYYCNPEAKDARRFLRRSLQWDSSFLISAFESVMSLSLTKDLSAAWKDYLGKKKGKGCLGNGNLLSVVFQLDMEAMGL